MDTNEIQKTLHVFRLRKRVKEKIKEKKPEAVCLELDEKRYEALLRDEISLNPLHLMQQGIAEMYGEKLGNDMIGGAEGAKEVNAKIFFIDKPIEEIMEKLMHGCFYEFLNPMEILRKFFTMFSLSASMPAVQIMPSIKDFSHLSFSFRDWINRGIMKFEADPERYRNLFGEMYPYFRQILLNEREEHMAAKIREVKKEGYEKIVVVIGAGHVPKLKNLLGDLDVEVIKLSQLM